MSKPPPLPTLSLLPRSHRGSPANRPRSLGLPTVSGPGPAAACDARHTREAEARGDGSPLPSRESGGPEFLKPLGRRPFGRYELLLEMGRGGMASLLLARLRGPLRFEKLLAVKRIHEHLSGEEEFVRMFLDEARIAAQIHHPNVAALFDLGEVEGAYFLAMEYVHGQTLTDVLRCAQNHPGPFSWPLVARIVADAAAGLHAAHSLVDQDGRLLGVVHRDVSPHNLLVSYDGHVKVIDFGIAYASRKLNQTGVGILKGKAGYMSPEQVDGLPLSARSDVFALGIVLWECLSRARLFHEDTDAATLMRLQRADIPPLVGRAPGLPARLYEIVQKALARRPTERIATAEALSNALEDLLLAEGEGVGPGRVAALMTTYFQERRRLKDQQIRIALRGTLETPAIAAPTPRPGRGADQGTRPSTRLERLGGRPWIFVLLPLVVLSLALGLVALLTRRAPATSHPDPGRRHGLKSARAPGTVAVPRPSSEVPSGSPSARGDRGQPAIHEDRRAAASHVVLTVTVEPARADTLVQHQRQQHRGAVSRLLVPRGAEPVPLHVRARGYQTQVLRVVPDRDREVAVQLVPASRKAHRRRSRAMLLDLD